MVYRTLVSDHSSEARVFKHRANFAAILCLLMILTLIYRLGLLQIVEYAYFSDLSENNRIRLMALPPNRGLIYDRNGVVLAENRPTFHLEIVPERVDDLSATLVELGEIVALSEQDLKRFWSSLKAHRPFESISLRTRLDDEEVARLAVNRHRFPSMDITARISRHYPQGESAVHVVGYVGRINEKEMAEIDTGNYRGTSHIGKTGLEKYYEAQLHGLVGQQNVEVNAEGRTLRVVDKVPPTPGNNLILSLDIELQKIAEEALGEYSGSVVAMVPQTGEVLVFVSKPTYDPNLFVHGISFKKYDKLRQGDEKPLFNRALYGQYPPGSTIKPFIAMTGLESTLIDAKNKVRCKGHFLIPDDETRRKYRDWKKTGHGTVNMSDALEQSCDVYFYELSYRLGIDRIHNFLLNFGFGTRTGIDLLGERSGLLPSRDWKRRVYGKKWFPGETLISGIGQGYMLTTPLQLAVATAALATKGLKVQPWLVKEILTADGKNIKIQTPERTSIKVRHESHWDVIHKAMKNVVHGTLGTARATGWRIKFKMAGKTGTAQVFGIEQGKEYDEKTIARKLRDHALFIGFAPYEKPTIAVAVIAENGEHGSWVAPIAGKIISRYLEKTMVSNDAKK